MLTFAFFFFFLKKKKKPINNMYINTFNLKLIYMLMCSYLFNKFLKMF